ncbi:uncharacterized protein ACJ7VT_018036 [Polymixia lowei]
MDMDGTIIILSEDDDSDCNETCDEPSVLIVDVEEVKKIVADDTLSPGVLNEDLVITFSQRAEVMPHARYDCPIHPFTTTDRETSAPVGNNHLICDQCFCYVCDKLASLCVVWREKGVCHCNSHKRSEFWSGLRDNVVLGYLKTFNLSLLEIDTHLRHAEMMLQSFRIDLAAQYSYFLRGKTALEYGLDQSNQQGLVHDYTQVYECVSLFLNKADKQEGRAAAIMGLGAAQDFISHFQPSGIVMSESPKASATEAKMMLMESLCVRPWDDMLLVSVLKGQNVRGVRTCRGKKDHLIEQISVVTLRTKLLHQQRRYRELCRYLRVVQTNDSKLFQELQDLIPLFLCKTGDFSSAVSSFFSSPNPLASRLSPFLFVLYLRIFDTATAPAVTIGLPARLDCPVTKWEPIEGAVPLKRAELVKFALIVQRSCTAVYTDSQCWVYLLALVNARHDSPTPLPEPSPAFLHVRISHK